MLSYTLCYTYLTNGNPQSFHKINGIVICTVGSSKSWHGDTNNPLSVELQPVKSLHTHQQSQCRIQTTADTYHNILAMSVNHSLCQPHHLNIEYLLAACLHIFTLWNKRMRVNFSFKLELTLVFWNQTIYFMNVSSRINKRILYVSLSINIG